LAENAKALEITLVKELGKIAPYLRKKGCPIMVKVLRLEPEGVTIKSLMRLFSKNTWLCKLVRGSIRPDTCPVLEG